MRNSTDLGGLGSAPVRGDVAQEPSVIRALITARAPARRVLAGARIGQGVATPTALGLGIRLRALTARDPRPVLRRERDDAPPPAAHRVRRTALESTALMPAPWRVRASAARSSSTSARSSRLTPSERIHAIMSSSWSSE